MHSVRFTESVGDKFFVITEVFRVLCPGGIFVASVSGIGTASRFLVAFNSVMAKWHQQFGKANVTASLFRSNPIGSMELHEVVGLLQGEGFSLDLARMDFEPVVYGDASDYQEDARAYGYEMFLQSIPANVRQTVWDLIGREFVKNTRAPYVHEQYMIYFRARRSRVE